MLIYTQSGTLINADKLEEIGMCEETGTIIASFDYGRSIILGEYGNGYEAEQVMKRIAQSYGAIACFEMPDREDWKK